MKLITWNVDARSGRVEEQVRFLVRRQPDIVALQEVSAQYVRTLLPALRDAGWEHVHDSLDRVPPAAPGNRRRGVLVAGRRPLSPIRGTADGMPWPEKAVSVAVDGIEVHSVHVPPGSSNGWIKIETLEAIYRALVPDTSRPRILCGDFNTPQEELADGTVVTWAQRIRRDGAVMMARRIRKQPAERWDLGERRVLTGLAEYGLVDVFRALHGYGAREFSWELKRRDLDRTVRRRFDHVFASPELGARTARYLHEARESRLSDHSPLEVEFAGAP